MFSNPLRFGVYCQILVEGLLDWNTQQKVAGLDWITLKRNGITKIARLFSRLHNTGVECH